MANEFLKTFLEDVPAVKKIQVEGYPVLYAHRVEPEKIVSINHLLPSGDAMQSSDVPDVSAFMASLASICLGDESGPGAFDNVEGLEFCRKMPIQLRNAVNEALQEVTEVFGPSEARKKKYPSR